MKKSKQVVKVVMHQHRDKIGQRVCGAPHPIDAEHKKASTQKLHDLTIKRS